MEEPDIIFNSPQYYEEMIDDMGKRVTTPHERFHCHRSRVAGIVQC